MPTTVLRSSRIEKAELRSFDDFEALLETGEFAEASLTTTARRTLFVATLLNGETVRSWGPREAAQIADQLVDDGADVTVVDRFEETPRSMARLWVNIIIIGVSVLFAFGRLMGPGSKTVDPASKARVLSWLTEDPTQPLPLSDPGVSEALYELVREGAVEVAADGRFVPPND